MLNIFSFYTKRCFSEKSFYRFVGGKKSVMFLCGQDDAFIVFTIIFREQHVFFKIKTPKGIHLPGYPGRFYQLFLFFCLIQLFLIKNFSCDLFLKHLKKRVTKNHSATHSQDSPK